MQFTQTYSNAQTLTTFTVNDITQSSASLESQIAQKSSSNTSGSCYHSKNYDVITSRLHEIALSTTAQNVTQEPLSSLASIQSNSPIKPTSSSNSLSFSQNSHHDSFKEINKILSNGMEKSREDLITAVQDHFNSLLSIHDSIATTVPSPEITLDYFPCSLIGRFFGMVERNAREIIAEDEVYSGYMIPKFFGLVESKRLESICSDYSLPQFYKMVKLETKLPVKHAVYETHMIANFMMMNEITVKQAYTSNQKLTKPRSLLPLRPVYKKLSKFPPCTTSDAPTVSARLYCKPGHQLLEECSTRLNIPVNPPVYEAKDEPTAAKKLSCKSEQKINILKDRRERINNNPWGSPTNQRNHVPTAPESLYMLYGKNNKKSNIPGKPRVHKFFTRNNPILKKIRTKFQKVRKICSKDKNESS